jgi:peptidyl-prolyl cis-trans isomerase C
MGRAVRSMARDPLVHFLVIGCALFGAYLLLEDDRGEPPPTEIRLTLDDLSQLLTGFEAQWGRQPTQEEFNALVEDLIRQDVLYREALALGLDKDDTIVKRRMVQKMQFLAEDLAAAHEPTGDELRDWFAQNSDLFVLPPRLSFRHLYFSPDKRGEHAREDAAAALEVLEGEPQTAAAESSLGDAFMFQDYYRERTSQTIARDFGPEFAEAVMSLTPGSWQGPIESGYGWHLVFVDSVIPSRVPAFEEIEQEVKTAWLGAQKAEAWRKTYEELRAKYTVLLPVPADEAGAAASEVDLPGDATAQDDGADR